MRLLKIADKKVSSLRKAASLEEKKKALLKYLKEENLVPRGTSIKDISVSDDKYYSVNDMEFIVGTEEECFEFAKESTISLYDDLGMKDAFGKNIMRIILEDENIVDVAKAGELQDEDVESLVEDFEGEEGRIKEELEYRDVDTEGMSDEEMKDKLTELMLREEPLEWLKNYLDGMDSDQQKGYLDYHNLIDKDAMAEYLVNYESDIANELASYDGEEIDLGKGLYAYRVN